MNRPDNLPAAVVPGAVISWRCWHGGTARATVTRVDRFRVSTDTAGIYWETTCYRSAAESMLSMQEVTVTAP